MDSTQEQLDAERAHFLEVSAEVFGYETFETEVDRFHACNARMKIVSCPARTSKSYAAVYDVLPDILLHIARAGMREPDGSLKYPKLETLLIWIVAPHFELAKEFSYLYDALIVRREKVGLDRNYYTVKEEHNRAAQGNMLIHLNLGRNARGEDIDVIVRVLSAANEKQLQSEEVDIAILSEAARLTENVWAKYLSTRVGRVILPTTPDRSAMWIHKLIEESKKDPSLNIGCFQFTPRANPKYKYKRYWEEHRKAEIRVDPSSPSLIVLDTTKPPTADNGHDCFDPLIQCVAMKDEGFAEQFGGQWNFYRGRVVPLREEISATGQPSHIIHEDREWFKWCDIHVAFDYGFTDPAVVGFWLVGPKQVVLRRSIYECGLTGGVLADQVRHIIKVNKWEGRVTRFVGDPKKPEVRESFRKRGMPIYEQDKNAQADREAGHLELMHFLATNPVTGEPSMLIHADNAKVIEEWRNLSYSDQVRDPNSKFPFKKNQRDDAYDMARYFVQSHPPVEKGGDLVRLEQTDFANLRRSVLRGRPKRTVTVGRPHASGLAAPGL